MTTTTLSAPPRRIARSIEVSDLLIWVILGVLVVVNVLFQPSFLTLRNLEFVFSSSLVLLFAAAAAGYVMLIAEIDLSVGAVMTLVNVLIATLTPTDPVLAIALGLVVGVACGLSKSSKILSSKHFVP